MIHAGELRHKVTIKSRSSSLDSDYGGQSTTWSTTVLTAWAKIRPLSARETFAAQQFATEVSHVIHLRYDSSLSDPKAVAAMRVEFGSRIFNIHGVINVDERDTELQLLCSEGLNDG